MNETPAPRPLSAADLLSLALEARRQGDAARAERYGSALRAAGALAPAVASAAFRLEREARLEEAEGMLRFGLELAPEDADLRTRLGRLRLLQGDYREGWALHESRAIHMTATMRGRPRLPFPEWRGEPVRSLLVFLEQGLGDQIHFARYLPVLRERGIDVAFVCAPPLIRLLAPLGARLYPADAGQPLPRCEAWCMMMSLPFILGDTLETLPRAPYLSGAPAGNGVGVVTRGNPLYAHDAERSLPAALGREFLQSIPGAISLHPEDTGVRDMEDTRQIISGLAAVVTTCTSVAHLAGAMGKPTHVMLSFAPDWRWLATGDASPWYPSVRLHRQARPGEWGPVLAAARAAVAGV